MSSTRKASQSVQLPKRQYRIKQDGGKKKRIEKGRDALEKNKDGEQEPRLV